MLNLILINHRYLSNLLIKLHEILFRTYFQRKVSPFKLTNEKQHIKRKFFIEGFVPNKVVSIFSFGSGPRSGASCTRGPRRRPAPAAVSMATGSNDVSIPRRGAPRVGGRLAGWRRSTRRGPLAPLPTVGPCKMTDVNFGYTYLPTSLEGNDIFIKMKMR